jgi:hypothetical protein
VAATIAFLASTGAGYITGQNIKVDGGLMRSVKYSQPDHVRRPCRQPRFARAVYFILRAFLRKKYQSCFAGDVEAAARGALRCST